MGEGTDWGEKEKGVFVRLLISIFDFDFLKFKNFKQPL
jgi:hypothetical protein